MIHGKNVLRLSCLLGLLLLVLNNTVVAQTIVGNIGLGDNPTAAAVDPVLNKVYVANTNSNNVTAISEFTNSSTNG